MVGHSCANTHHINTTLISYNLPSTILINPKSVMATQDYFPSSLSLDIELFIFFLFVFVNERIILVLLFPVVLVDDGVSTAEHHDVGHQGSSRGHVGARAHQLRLHRGMQSTLLIVYISLCLTH